MSPRCLHNIIFSGKRSHAEPQRKQREDIYILSFILNQTVNQSCGKEREHGGGRNSYDFSARNLIAPLGQWGVPDTKAEKYFSYSPYSYCAGDPINRIDDDGMEVRSLSCEEQLIKAAKNYPDNGNIIAFLHGNDGYMLWDSTGEEIHIADGATLMNALASEFDTVDALTMYDDPLVIELHSCETGFNKNGGVALAQRFSKEIPNTIILAPNGTLLYDHNNNKEVVASEIKNYSTNPDGSKRVQYSRQTEIQWKVFFKGFEIPWSLIELCKSMIKSAHNDIFIRALEKVIFQSMPSGNTYDIAADFIL